MKYSNIHCPTLKEDPASVEVASHRLLLRAGMIRQVASGIYDLLPLGLKVIRKVEAIVREEMNRAGAQEVLMPLVHPAELWQETGRWESNGKELLRFRDRHDRDFCLAPTHEEVVTDLIRKDVRSYKQLPINLYQIQTKFRDEVRPRFGLMRGREFTMKDAYSFDCDEESQMKAYEAMKAAYERIFSRCGLGFRRVHADSGNIGGSRSEEFMVLAKTGEDEIVHCKSCGYSANTEKARTLLNPSTLAKESFESLELVDTPDQKTIDEVVKKLQVHPTETLKVLLYQTEKGPVAAVLPGHRDLSEIAFQRALQAQNLRPLSPEELAQYSQVQFGSIGPMGLKEAIPVLADILFDSTIVEGRRYCVGANQNGKHYVGVQAGIDFAMQAHQVHQIHKAEVGDLCCDCNAPLQIERGIEVGHIFALGTKYSEAMNCNFMDEDGKEKPMVMGCYGIGIGRTAQAAIEQGLDEQGMVLPPAIAPFEVVIDVVKWKDEVLQSKALELYETLREHGYDVLLDDRDQSLGAKLKDADLLGISCRLVVGHKGLENNQIEAKLRWEKEAQWLAPDKIVDWIKSGFEKKQQAFLTADL
ncbi:MAG: proline--tRNA ligase [Bdellovibrionales bacterium]|nr:proline--tRNA ligase [Bdellovibrionales bacterium]